MKSASQFSLGHDKRIMTKPHDTFAAGPGSHERASSFGIGPKFSMAKIVNTAKDEGLPGPGHYNFIS